MVQVWIPYRKIEKCYQACYIGKAHFSRKKSTIRTICRRSLEAGFDSLSDRIHSPLSLDLSPSILVRAKIIGRMFCFIFYLYVLLDDSSTDSDNTGDDGHLKDSSESEEIDFEE